MSGFKVTAPQKAVKVSGISGRFSIFSTPKRLQKSVPVEEQIQGNNYPLWINGAGEVKEAATAPDGYIPRNKVTHTMEDVLVDGKPVDLSGDISGTVTVVDAKGNPLPASRFPSFNTEDLPDDLRALWKAAADATLVHVLAQTGLVAE